MSAGGTSTGGALARAAERLAGARFRLHGRDPTSGLDCIGLLGAALGAIGEPPELPRAYGLRNSNIDSALAFAARAGLIQVEGAIEAGDVLLVAPGRAQHHLMIALAGNRFVHAHAGLRRVVVTPGPLAEPVLRHWRLRLAED